MVRIQIPEQLQGGRALGMATGRQHAAPDREPIAILHEHVPGVEQLGLVAVPFAS